MKKIAFFGSKPIGYYCLQYLMENAQSMGCQIVAILSNENSRFDSTLSLKKIAGDNNIFFGNNLVDFDKFDGEIDFIISVQYHEILKKKHIERALELAVNLHMAPLPEYRGCNQFSFAIYNEEIEFGTTLHQLEEGIDSGKIIFESRFPIENVKSIEKLYDVTFVESKKLFKNSIRKILEGNFTAIEQRKCESFERSRIYYRDDIKELKSLNLNDNENEIIRRVNATSMPGFEPPFTVVNNKKYYILTEDLFSKYTLKL